MCESVCVYVCVAQKFVHFIYIAKSVLKAAVERGGNIRKTKCKTFAQHIPDKL